MRYLNLWILDWSCWCRRANWTIALRLISHDEGLRTRWGHLLFMRCWLRILNITTFPDLCLREELFAFWGWSCLCRCRLFRRLRRWRGGGPWLRRSGLSRGRFIAGAFPYKLSFAHRAIALPIVFILGCHRLFILRLELAIWAFSWWGYISVTEFFATR